MKKSIFILLGLLAIISCDEDNDIKPEKVESYPVSVGKEWVYSRELIIKKYESETSNTIVGTDVLDFTVKVWVEKDTILSDTMNVIKFKSQEEGADLTTDQYMFVDSDGLKCYAYSNAGGPNVFAKKKGMMIFNSVAPFGYDWEPGEIIVENEPTLNVKLPLELGAKWVFRYPTELQPLQINKSVVGIEILYINGKAFNCYKVEWDYLYDPNFDNVKLTEWISKEGLVKRQIVLDRVTFTSVDGEPVGNQQTTETITLKELK